MRGRTIKLYIMGDSYKYLKTAELSNWTGKAYIGQRKHVNLLDNFEDLNAPGIYILLSDIEDSYQKRIYIGEADEISKRINDHFRHKDWWNEFVIFTSKDSNLTKAHARYLEKKLYEIATKNKTTIELNNGSTPPGSKLPESDIDDMNEFCEHVIFVLKNLGILDFTKMDLLPDLKQNNQRIDNATFILNVPGTKGEASRVAKLTIIEGVYRLLEGSYIRRESVNSFASHNYARLRKQLESENYFKKTDSNSFYQLNKDVDFNSPSAAGAIARNSSINGRKEWKLPTGMSLDEYENIK